MSADKKRKAAAKKAPRRKAGKLASVFDTESFLTTVGAGRSISTFKAKAVIFRQGVECDAVFYILKGLVDLSVVSAQGKERVVGQI